MNDLEVVLTSSYDRHAGRLGTPDGDVADVYRPADRRRSRRRTLTVVASVALVGAGVAGIAGVQAIGDGAPAAGSPSDPAGPSDRGYWFVCEQPVGDGEYAWCDLENAVGAPLWRCSDPLPDPWQDGDDRPRFGDCRLVEAEQPLPSLPPPSTDMACASVPQATSATDHQWWWECTWPGDPCAAVPQATSDTGEVARPSGCSTEGTFPPATAPAWNVDTVPSATEPPATEPASPAAPTDTTPPTAVPASSRPTESLPTEPVAFLAFGDSVMQSAAPTLTERGWTIDADKVRQLVDLIPLVTALAEGDLVGDPVLIHVGTNGPFTQDQLDDVLDPLTDVPNVILLTVHADRSWTAGNNELIRAADARPNVIVLDWDARAGDCPGDCFYEDGLHLRPDGVSYYADLIANYAGR